MTDSILLVHADPDALRRAGSHLEELGYDVTRELNTEAGFLTAARLRPEVVLLHHSLAGGEEYPHVAHFRAGEAGVILLVPSDGEQARIALEAGAELAVPDSASLPLLAAATARAAERIRAWRAAASLMRRGVAAHGTALLGSRSPMDEIVQQVGVFAQADRTTVLLTGEQGVGKGYVARLLHDLGPRARQPFFQCRCAGTTAAELEALLFGYEKGAFPGATERRQGLLELARGGTVLLHDVADLPVELQPKLLRFLETRAFRRMGGARDLQVDTRLLVATERVLGEEVSAGRFRDDLAYRLGAVTLELPPLRERAPEDRDNLIELIHQELLGEISDGPTVISVEARDRMLAHLWPGNVRELRNILDRALLLARGQQILNVEHLPGELRARPGVGDRRHTPRTLEEVERQQIERALQFHGGNRTRAAKELGISRATLINKVKLYRLNE